MALNVNMGLALFKRKQRYQGGTEAVSEELPTPPVSPEAYQSPAVRSLIDQVRQGILPDDTLAEIQRDPTSLRSILGYGEAAMAAGTLLSGGEGGTEPIRVGGLGGEKGVVGGVKSTEPPPPRVPLKQPKEGTAEWYIHNYALNDFENQSTYPSPEAFWDSVTGGAHDWAESAPNADKIQSKIRAIGNQKPNKKLVDEFMRPDEPGKTRPNTISTKYEGMQKGKVSVARGYGPTHMLNT